MSWQLWLHTQIIWYFVGHFAVVWSLTSEQMAMFSRPLYCPIRNSQSFQNPLMFLPDCGTNKKIIQVQFNSPEPYFPSTRDSQHPGTYIPNILLDVCRALHSLHPMSPGPFIPTILLYHIRNLCLPGLTFPIHYCMLSGVKFTEPYNSRALSSNMSTGPYIPSTLCPQYTTVCL